MEMALNMGAFEALNQQEMLDVDGGEASFGQAVGATGGTVAFAWGTLITFAGVATANPAVAGAGFGLACTGIGTIAANI